MNNIHVFTDRELGTNEIRIQNVADLPKEIKERKGVSYYFEPGDIIQFEENPIVRIESFEGFEGRIVPAFSIRAYCKRWGEFFFSLALTRRTPLNSILEGQEKSEMDILMEDNDLGARLIIKQADYDRMKLLDGKTIRVKDRLRMHQPSWDKDKKEFDYNKLLPLTCYKWEIVE